MSGAENIFYGNEVLPGMSGSPDAEDRELLRSVWRSEQAPLRIISASMMVDGEAVDLSLLLESEGQLRAEWRTPQRSHTLYRGSSLETATAAINMALARTHTDPHCQGAAVAVSSIRKSLRTHL